MGKRTKPKKQPPRVVRHIFDQLLPSIQVVERDPPPPGAASVGRLETILQRFQFDADGVAGSINFRPGVSLCDSTVFLAPTDNRIWQALLREKRVVLIPPILDEMQLWINEPKGVNLDAHKQVQAHLTGDESAQVQTLDPPPTQELINAAVYYINLLGARKHMAKIARQKLERELGRQVSAQEVSNHLQQYGTSRAQLLARQGEEAKVSDHLYHDERLVVAALLLAIVSGREATVITSDEAVLDQFVKMTCLLNWHYLAMVLADHYADNPSAFTTRLVDNPDSTVLEDDKVLLLQKPSSLCLELLPSRPAYVMAHCMLLQKEVRRVSYNAEMGMRQMLDIKGRTGGLTTERLNGMNCHLYLTAEARAKAGDYAAIVHDKTAPIGDTGMRLAGVDLGHSLHSNEQCSAINTVYRT